MRKNYKESNLSTGLYLQLLNYGMIFGMGTKNALLKIPAIFYPDNPALHHFFPYLNSVKWLKAFGYLSPFMVIANVLSTWETIKHFYHNENKNFNACLNLALSSLTTSASIIFYSLICAGTAYVVLHIAPFVLMAAAMLNALYSLYNIGKHIYFAYLAKDAEQRKHHLQAILKHILALLINSLAAVITFFLGMQVDAKFLSMLKCADLWTDLQIMESVGKIFKSALTYVYIFAGAAGIGVIYNWIEKTINLHSELFADVAKEGLITIVKKNLQTKWDHLKEFMTKLNIRASHAKYIITPLVFIAAVCLETVSLVFKTLFIIAATVLSAPVLIAKSKISSQKAVKKESEPGQAKSEQATPEKTTEEKAHYSIAQNSAALFQGNKKQNVAVVDKQLLLEKIITKKNALQKQMDTDKVPSPKRQSKMNLLMSMEDSLIKGEDKKPAELLANAKKISPRVFQSFKCETGEVEAIFQNYAALLTIR